MKSVYTCIRFIISLSDLCPGVEKKISTELLSLGIVGVMKLTILVDPSLAIIIEYIFCPIYAKEYRRKFLKKNVNFTFLTPKLSPLWVGGLGWVGGHKIYNFLSPFLTDATYQIW